MTLSVKIDKYPRIELNARRTLEGNLMIFDHEDIDIVLMIEKKKCIVFPKEELTDKTYSAQDRIFSFLSKRGVIDLESIRGGNVFGSMEASILESKLPGIDSTQVMLYVIHEYINDERPYFATKSKDYEEDYLDSLLRPKGDDVTNLGDVPQSDKKGSMDQRVRPWGYMYNYSLIREEKKRKKED